MTFRCGFTVDLLRFYNSVVAVLQYFYCGFAVYLLRFYRAATAVLQRAQISLRPPQATKAPFNPPLSLAREGDFAPGGRQRHPHTTAATSTERFGKTLPNPESREEQSKSL